MAFKSYESIRHRLYFEYIHKTRWNFKWEYEHFWSLKNSVFWDVAPCRSCVNWRFGGTYRLHLQGRKIRERGTSVIRWLQPHWATSQKTAFLLSDRNGFSMYRVRIHILAHLLRTVLIRSEIFFSKMCCHQHITLFTNSKNIIHWWNLVSQCCNEVSHIPLLGTTFLKRTKIIKFIKLHQDHFTHFSRVYLKFHVDTISRSIFQISSSAAKYFIVLRTENLLSDAHF
jgi:hypothetical protein